MHEQLLLDLAAYVNHLKDACGVERVVWLGNSGGGSLGCFYQQQAKLRPSERLKRTPGGRPIPLADASMPAFDAMLITAAHTGQGLIINEVIDPSVADESDPFSRVPELDMYNPDNGWRPWPEPWRRSGSAGPCGSRWASVWASPYASWRTYRLSSRSRITWTSS